MAEIPGDVRHWIGADTTSPDGSIQTAFCVYRAGSNAAYLGDARFGSGAHIAYSLETLEWLVAHMRALRPEGE